ncbi:hypothetical protein HD806DRAFT_517383 [Xylariaceae sp. AK1471]|nr:hypothetical protein HD806DRAFT_517383 [Xylariaceae sp. AK1471]
MNTRLRTIETRLEIVETRLETMDTWMREREVRDKARQLNTFAQLVNNSQATNPENKLKPLRAVATNQQIASFPQTVAAMDRLGSAAVNNILRQLEQPTEGVIAERRQRLKWCTGLFIQAT